MPALRWFRAGALVACLALAWNARAHEEHETHADADLPPPLGASLTEGWLDPWPHSHFSRRGAPRVHPFGIEPAFLGRDLLIDYHFVHGDEGVEHELEAELEWALTRRIGLIVEAPFLVLDPDEGETESGIGDVGLGLRFVLVDTERMLISANVAAALPTGDEDRGLGSDEVILEPSLGLWLDLGGGFTASAQLGTEHATETGDDALVYGLGIAYSFQGPALLDRPHAPHDEHAGHAHAHDHVHAGHPHFPPGFTSLIAEITGSVVLDGEDDGAASHQLLLGISYSVSDWLEVRAAFQASIGQPREFDEAIIAGLIFHF